MNEICNSYGLVYKITNTLNNKIYIGQTTKTLNFRFKFHVWDAFNRNRRTTPFHNAIRKYGSEVFTKEILIYCNNKEALDYWECFYIGKYNSIIDGYNLLTLKSAGGHSLETRKKIGEKSKASNHVWKATVAATLANTNKPCSEETRSRISKSNIGKIIDEETRSKMSLAKKGKTSPAKGKTMSNEQKQKISLALKGNQNGSKKKIK